MTSKILSARRWFLPALLAITLAAVSFGQTPPLLLRLRQPLPQRPLLPRFPPKYWSD